MTTSTFFELRVLRHHWIKDEGDDPDDLCSHGKVFAQIGDEIICNKDILEVTTSAAALHLMRTLKQDYYPWKYAGPLLPCCGHFRVPSDNLQTVDAYCCGNGLDWTVTHLEGVAVELVANSGTAAIISFENYKSQILAFADSVEQFYKESEPKVIPEDDFDRNGYTAFWNEWHSLRQEWV